MDYKQKFSLHYYGLYGLPQGRECHERKQSFTKETPESVENDLQHWHFTIRHWEE
jgi:hypothetical protein